MLPAADRREEAPALIDPEQWEAARQRARVALAEARDVMRRLER
jgi:hypothetical protein